MVLRLPPRHERPPAPVHGLLPVAPPPPAWWLEEAARRADDEGYSGGEEYYCNYGAGGDGGQQQGQQQGRRDVEFGELVGWARTHLFCAVPEMHAALARLQGIALDVRGQLLWCMAPATPAFRVRACVCEAGDLGAWRAGFGPRGAWWG